MILILQVKVQLFNLLPIVSSYNTHFCKFYKETVAYSLRILFLPFSRLFCRFSQCSKFLLQYFSKCGVVHKEGNFTHFFLKQEILATHNTFVDTINLDFFLKNTSKGYNVGGEGAVKYATHKTYVTSILSDKDENQS